MSFGFPFHVNFFFEMFAFRSFQTLYGIQVYLEEPCFVAVVTRPKLLTLPMAAHDQITHAPSDERVKMLVSGSNNNKVISMQVR